MRVGSLCTGIGGLDLAVEAHFAAETVWCAEFEECLDPIIQRHFGPVLNLRDLKTIDWGELEPVDILTAGYPCQPFSHAGKRKGTDDPRHLWPHIFDAVRVLRPGRVVLENVAGHLSLGFGDVLGDLAAAGFDAEWCVLRAADVGAPHNRARVFIVASDTDSAGAGRDRGSVGGPSEQAEARPANRREQAAGSPDVHLGASTDSGGERHGGGEDTGAVGRVDRGHASEAWERQRPRTLPGDRSGTASTYTAGERRPGRDLPCPDVERDGLQPALVGAGTDPRHPDTAWGQYEPAIRRWEHVLGRPAPAPTDTAGRLSPDFVCWMMGYPAGWVDGLTRTQALKALGNAVVPQQALAALNELAPIREQAA